MIAALDSDDSLQFWWQPIGSQQWNQEQVAGPGTVQNAQIVPGIPSGLGQAFHGSGSMTSAMPARRSCWRLGRHRAR
jgi:hypothetical protein